MEKFFLEIALSSNQNQEKNSKNVNDFEIIDSQLKVFNEIKEKPNKKSRKRRIFEHSKL
jgi:hypothetical protein